MRLCLELPHSRVARPVEVTINLDIVLRVKINEGMACALREDIYNSEICGNQNETIGEWLQLRNYRLLIILSQFIYVMLQTAARNLSLICKQNNLKTILY